MNLYSPKVWIALFVFTLAVPGTSCREVGRASDANPGNHGRKDSRTYASASAQININTADVSSLITLDGIGPGLANAIVEHRTRYGPFRKPEQLMMVERVGEKLFLKIRHRISVIDR